MGTTDNRYLKTRKILSSEKPYNERASNVLVAKNRVLAEQEKQSANWKKLEEKQNRAISIWKAKQSKKPIAGRKTELNKILPEQIAQRNLNDFSNKFYSTSLKNKFYKEWSNVRILIGGKCEPDIDSISSYSISPSNEGIHLYGTCFGPSQGKVLFEIKQGKLIELEVLQWEDTHIFAFLNPLVTALRPYYGKIWIKTGTGLISNEWPLAFKPIITNYWGSISFRIDGGFSGKSINDIALDGKVLNDPDFRIEKVEKSHSGDGWSKLRSPNAIGNAFAQGYHIGVNAFGHAHLSIIYHLEGPRDVPLPAVPINFVIVG
jgi:hypothetical protein